MPEMSETCICLQTACTCGKSMDQQNILLLVEVYRTKMRLLYSDAGS